MEDTERIDFESKVIKTVNDWPTVIAKEQDIFPLDTVNGPLWRFILCRIEENEKQEGFAYKYVILLKFHHAIADGKSASDMLYGQYLPILSAVINKVDPENIIPFVSQTKCVEELFLMHTQLANPVPGYMKLLVDIYRWKNRVFGYLSKPMYRFAEEGDISQEENTQEPECIPRVFGVNVCGAVINAAKERGVNVHCVLLTAGVVALCRTAKTAGIEMPTIIKQAWPIDLRKFLDYKSPQPLGDIHAIGETNHKCMSHCSAEELWKSCSEVSTAVMSESALKKCTKWLG